MCDAQDGKETVIWEFFCKDEDCKYDICNKCKTKVPRSSLSTKSYTTTILIQHKEYFTEGVIPKICNGMKEEVSRLSSSNEPVVSLTTDIWSCSSNDTTLWRLTAHWIDKSFAKVSSALYVQALEMVHTGEYKAERISKLGYPTGTCSLSDQ